MKYQGVWLLCDNDYLKWSCTVPPYKKTNSFKHILFSKWVKSMQKDIKCAFVLHIEILNEVSEGKGM